MHAMLLGNLGTVLLSNRYSRSCRTEETWLEMLLAELWGDLGTAQPLNRWSRVWQTKTT